MGNARGSEEQAEAAETEAPPPLHGDVLETIFSKVPLPDLVPASHVSKSWKRLIYTNPPPPNPWLILLNQSLLPPFPSSLHAFDPRSHLWFHLKPTHPLPITSHFPTASLLRSSHSSLVHTLSPSTVSFSFDPFHLTWHHLTHPFSPRIDPIVALVGRRHLVVTGGARDFEDDPSRVDIYDLNNREWDTCQPLPAPFKDSASPTWLSFATSTIKLLVAEKSSGQAYALDIPTKTWNGPYNCLIDINNNNNKNNNSTNFDLCCCLIGCDTDRWISVGFFASEGEEMVTRVKIWELDDKSFAVCRELGEMPKEIVDKLGVEVFSVKSKVSLCFVGEWVFLVNGSTPEVVVFCVLSGGVWGSVRNDAVGDGDASRIKERLVFTCARVGVGDLERAMVCGKMTFAVK